MMKLIAAEETRSALPFDALVDELRRLFATGCEVPPRQVLDIAAPSHGSSMVSLVMPAWLPDRYYGVKTINIAPSNAARGLPGLHAAYMLFDAVTGVPLAVIDGDQVTNRRTAAASALAASYLAREDASHLLVVGAGRIARLLPEAYRAVRPIHEVTVWARDAAKAVELARSLAAEGFDARPTDDLARAAGEADIVSCATLATAPVLQGRWLRPGSHLDLIGSFTPAMREADDDCFAGASIFVDTREALTKSGELIGPISRGVFAAQDVRAALDALCRGDAPGRASREERTVFKSVGTALEDLAAAILAWESAAGISGAPPTAGPMRFRRK